MLVYTVTVAEF